MGISTAQDTSRRHQQPWKNVFLLLVMFSGTPALILLLTTDVISTAPRAVLDFINSTSWEFSKNRWSIQHSVPRPVPHFPPSVLLGPSDNAPKIGKPMRKGSRKLQRGGLKRNRMSPHHRVSSGLVTLQRIRTAAVSIGPAYFTTVTMDEWGNISEETAHACTSHGQTSCIPANGHDSGRFRTCAIVGSGDILTGSLCGTDIDTNDYVIRFNLAPTVGFEQDVGNKANLTILNKEILDRVKASLKSKDSEGFANRLKQMKTSIFLYAKGRRTDIFRSLLQLALTSNISITLEYIEAHHRTAKIIMKIFPRYDRDFDSYVTTGLIGVVVATTLCNKITLYGFYPFDTDLLRGRNLSYHYYLNIDGHLGEPNNKVHDYKTEYKLLRALEKRRLLTLVKEPCQRNIR